MLSPDQPGRKDMSYRKPAPKYTPSPPPSPLSSPGSLFNRLSISPGSPTADETPPLPEDWREVIKLAMAANASTRSVATSTADVADMAVSSPSILKERVLPTISGDDRSHSHDSFSPGENPAQSPTPGRNRRPHLSYRPPTPPLQVHYKRRRAPDDESGFTSLMMPCRMIYPDLPWLHDSQDAYGSSSMPSLSTSPSGNSFSTLTTNRIMSVKTEKSQCLSANIDSDASMTWPEDLSTFISDTDPSLNLPVIPNDHAGDVVKQYGGADVEERSSELYILWRRASAWVRTRLGSVNVSESFC